MKHDPWQEERENWSSAYELTTVLSYVIAALSTTQIFPHLLYDFNIGSMLQGGRV